ncbi:hypothetical protein E4T56_gene3154 [Termitomyces sp. T112]|nr:hypothetical protein E4T56_gene3154 [Termitomyces sp. T112]
MFSVKATYNGEIRKFSFPNSTTFPTYEQLYYQLARVFPSTNNYYLHKLLFFPDASQPGRILIGSQVRNAEEYNRCIVAFRDRTWPNASLRFTLMNGKTDIGAGVSICQTVGQLPQAGPSDEALNRTDSASQSRPFFIPPSPVTFTVPPRAVSQIPLDNEPLMDMSNNYSASSSMSSFESISFNRASNTAVSCCSTFQVKKDVESLIKAFQRDLDQAMGRLAGSTTPNVTHDPTPSQIGSTSFYSPLNCLFCKNSASGQWFTCNDCSVVVCSQCNLRNIVCPVSGAQHALRLTAGPPELSIWPSTVTVEPTSYSPFIPPLPRFLDVNPSEPYGPTSPSFITPIVTSRTPPPPPVIHQGIICDSCNLIIEGVRHKCLDCPDYDLCTPCIAHGAHERHNIRHQLLDITEPGRVVARTVNQSENHEDRALYRRSSLTPNQPPSPPVVHPVVHHATCDLCDSTIEGHRYKCAVCPDFDTCESCFAITEEQHPCHSFVRICKKEDYISRESSFSRRHFARCDACDMTIVGIRYKCMHPDCPDFDLCERCEAHPIPQHPDTHPFLKMKSVETAIPMVYRPPEAIYNTSMHSWTFKQIPLEERTVRSYSPLVDGIVSDSELPPMRPPCDNSAVSSSFVSPHISPGLVSQDLASGVVHDPICDSLYPLSDPLIPIGSWSQSTSSTRTPQEVTTHERAVAPLSPLCELTVHSLDYLKTSMSPSSSASTALLDVNDTPAVPGSWYSNGLNSLLNDSVDERNGTRSANEASIQTSQRSTQSPTHSPLYIEAPINRPPTPHLAETHEFYPLRDTSLAEFLTVHHLMSNLSTEEQAAKGTSNSAETPLSAGYLEDITAPDGQIFAAGATFIKIWRMVNNGIRAWPANTEVVFVGGAQLTSGNSLPHIQHMCLVGPLKPGQEKTVWTPELKAPDTPGRYTSYWRLRDDQGQLFGDSIWVDIEVVDPSQSEESVTSSSIIIMPNPTSPPSPVADEQTISRSLTTDIEDSLDDYLSDSSSVSIVSMPSSEDEADATLWEESRTQDCATSPEIRVQATADHVVEHASTAMDYVLLYDDNTSEEE